ncbi:hypothetical protein [Microbispora sp. GKU 823]|uniref:hypothetical protein n=1 Tax=Microbispora sp. GKU 823 TaxID=1652100 RepID=UPI00118052DF|nr:hypothetical protein [Microbispora sp. GKU 823]
MPGGKLTTALIRSWRAALIDKGVSVPTAAKAFRLLRAVLMTAVEEDKLLSRNPCRIKDADNEQTPERPILTVAQVFELADQRFRALILLATFASLRWGEVIALRRSDIDLNARTVRVREQLIELDGGDRHGARSAQVAGRQADGQHPLGHRSGPRRPPRPVHRHGRGCVRLSRQARCVPPRRQLPA